MVCLKPFSAEAEANARASMLYLSGSAGFVFCQNNLYFVALATYLDYKSAQSVIKKNPSLELKTLTYHPQNSPKFSRDFFAFLKAERTLKSILAELHNLTLSYAKSELGSSELLTHLNTLIPTLTALKNSSPPTLLTPTTILLDGISALTTNPHSTNILAHLRLTLCKAVYSALCP